MRSRFRRVNPPRVISNKGSFLSEHRRKIKLPTIISIEEAADQGHSGAKNIRRKFRSRFRRENSA